MNDPPWYRREGDAWLLRIHAQPGAKTSGVAGRHGDALKIRVAAPPLEGRANQALVSFVAQRLGVPARAVQVIRGEHARAKTLRVSAPGADPARLEAGPGS